MLFFYSNLLYNNIKFVTGGGGGVKNTMSGGGGEDRIDPIFHVFSIITPSNYDTTNLVLFHDTSGASQKTMSKYCQVFLGFPIIPARFCGLHYGVSTVMKISFF